MKRYTIKLGIAFILSYILLMVVVVFAYTQISANFMMNQAETNLIKSAETVTKTIEMQLNYDYDKYKGVDTVFDRIYQIISDLDININELID